MAASCRAAVQASVGVRALVAGAPGVFWDFNPNLRDCATIGGFSQRGAVCPRGAPSYPPVTPMGALDIADGHIRTEIQVAFPASATRQAGGWCHPVPDG
jgi:hypothetical protein